MLAHITTQFLLQVRGLVTYCGAGTLFLDNQDADRKELQRRVFGGDTGGFGVRRGGKAKQAAAGDLLLLKGHSYAGNAGELRFGFVLVRWR